MFSAKRKLRLLLLLVLVRLPARSADQGDVIAHAVGAWNQDLKVFQTRAELAYAFRNDFSTGPVFEANSYYYTVAAGVTWHLEPFELLAHAGPLFWHKDGVKSTHIQFSIHANYLLQISTHFQIMMGAGINLPDKLFRGVPIGIGMRYWF